MPREQPTSKRGHNDSGNRIRKSTQPYEANRGDQYPIPTQSHSHQSQRHRDSHHQGQYEPVEPFQQQHHSYQRQPSAHLSEIGSLDEPHFPSQEVVGDGLDQSPGQYGQDRSYEMGRHRSRSISRQSTREGKGNGNSSSAQGYAEQGYTAMPPPQSKHPSAHRLARAKEVSQPPPITARVNAKVGRTIAPQAFQPISTSEPSRVDVKQRHSRDPLPQRGSAPPPPINNPPPPRRGPIPSDQGYLPPSKPVYPRSKLNQSTKFDTPSEKGRGSPSDKRSSEGQGHRTRRRDSGMAGGGYSDAIDVIELDLEASPSTNLSKHRARNAIAATPVPGQVRNFREVYPEIGIDLDVDVGIDDSFDLGTQGQGQRWDQPEETFLDQAVLLPTPPSERALPLVLKPKHHMLPSSDIDNIGDNLSELEDGFPLLEEINNEHDNDGSQLKLKMPKTVTQVVQHLTHSLAKKVAQAQGEQAIKSSDTWDWSRLPVLASEIEGSIKEMEQAIHTAGQERQAAIEGTKRNRVEMEAGNTEQYEEFRKDFREACEKMQQPARLGKKFKFGPF